MNIAREEKPDPSIAVEDPDTPDARACLEAYYRELAERFTEGFDPASHPLNVSDMRPPRGCFFIARNAGAPVGCAALLRLDAATGELKRMWVAEAARGQGVGRRLLHQAEAEARRMGLTVLRLDTNRALKEAQRFYSAEGYAGIARYNSNPYAHHWFEKKL